MRVLRFAVLLMLGGCAGPQSPSEAPRYDASIHARIRTFNENGVGINFYPGKTCYTESLLGIGDDYVSASRGFWSMMRENRSAGMPLPHDTPKNFHEHVVTAGQPLTIVSRFEVPGAVTRSCGPVTGSFTPQAGRDYEAYLAIRNNRCALEIREITVAGEKVETKPLPYSPALRCSDATPKKAGS